MYAKSAELAAATLLDESASELSKDNFARLEKLIDEAKSKGDKNPMMKAFTASRRTRRQAQELKDEAWLDLLGDAQACIGGLEDVELRTTSTFQLPMTIGVWHPTIRVERVLGPKTLGGLAPRACSHPAARLSGPAPSATNSTLSAVNSDASAPRDRARFNTGQWEGKKR